MAIQFKDGDGAFATLELLLTAAADVVEKKLTTSKELRVQENERRRKVRDCELCGVWARVHCEPDQARLCWDYDKKVHEANFLVVKHQRSLICRRCQSLTPWTGSGPKLTPTVSVCEIFIEHREKSEAENEGVDGEEEKDDGDDCDESDEDENQVVLDLQLQSRGTHTTPAFGDHIEVREVRPSLEPDGSNVQEPPDHHPRDDIVAIPAKNHILHHRSISYHNLHTVVSWLVDPPPAASCSSSEEEENEEEFSVSKRMRENADLGCDETEAFDWLRMLKRRRLGGENRLQSKRSTAMGSSKSRGLIMETEAINEDDDHDESR
ncbi:hypothetical protein DVH24_004305 [Malus domestica]|uniref:B box-type domain-containing protein n=1 Tax=Malus domestica TaxID=3750 RepID=A0A498KDW2_MALDO|nr:hypothetical protein DVH24_004305 [Malus domestica]